jgi:hypothetical protein
MTANAATVCCRFCAEMGESSGSFRQALTFRA